MKQRRRKHRDEPQIRFVRKSIFYQVFGTLLAFTTGSLSEANSCTGTFALVHKLKIKNKKVVDNFSSSVVLSWRVVGGVIKERATTHNAYSQKINYCRFRAFLFLASQNQRKRRKLHLLKLPQSD